MRRRSILLVLGMAGGVGAVQEPPRSDTLHWYTDLDRARVEARSRDCPLLLVFR